MAAHCIDGATGAIVHMEVPKAGCVMVHNHACRKLGIRVGQTRVVWWWRVGRAFQFSAAHTSDTAGESKLSLMALDLQGLSLPWSQSPFW